MSQQQSMLVCLDSGHGGHDPGAVGPTGLREADVNLAVARATRPLLEAAGFRVIESRPDDVLVPLGTRTRIANQANAHCFVSIHCNASENRTANGTETYAFSATSAGARLAGLVQTSLIQELRRRDRGVRFAGFQVLRETRMAACLVELAFISNPQEEALLRDPAFQALAAKAITEGVNRWRGPSTTHP